MGDGMKSPLLFGSATPADGYEDRFTAAYERLRGDGIESVLSGFKLQSSAAMSLPESEAFMRQLGYLLAPIARAAAGQLPGDAIDGALIGLCRGRDPSKDWERDDYVREKVALHALYWAAVGFPTVTLTDRQFAALSLSDLSESDLATLRAPWPDFILRLPGDIKTARHDGVELHALRLAVHEYQPGIWGIRCDFNRKVAFNEGQVTDLYESSGPTAVDELSAISSPIESSTERLVHLCTRALMCAVSTMNDFPPIEKCHGSPRANKRRASARDVPYTEYALGAPVTVDARQYVKDYVSSDVERYRRLRWLVRGHWRMQAHGESRLLRKRKWVEPYWKGPERGTVLLREHLIADELATRRRES